MEDELIIDPDYDEYVAIVDGNLSIAEVCNVLDGINLHSLDTTLMILVSFG